MVDYAYPMPGKSVFVTGATGGLGRHLAVELALTGATVLLHGRDAERLAKLAAEVRGEAPPAQVREYLADLSDLRQVRDLAQRIRHGEPRLDVLVNNAVVGGGSDPTKRELSRQGHELRLAVNHLAPLLLARELRPLLDASAPARIVNVASMGQEAIDFDNVMLETGYDGIRAYCQSKLALIMSTFDLAAELDPARVTVNAVHPAHLMDTATVRASGMTPLHGTDEGMRPTLRLITDPTLAGVSGRYFHQFDEHRAHDQAYDNASRHKLAALTTRLIG